jgi:hypothetical protein
MFFLSVNKLNEVPFLKIIYKILFELDVRSTSSSLKDETCGQKDGLKRHHICLLNAPLCNEHNKLSSFPLLEIKF